MRTIFLSLLISFFFCSCADGQVIINEFQASNTSDLLNQDSEIFEDWIELYNSQNEQKDISGFYLSDNSKKLKKWKIPNNTILDSKATKVFYASGLEDLGHISFRLSSKGGKIFFSDSLGAVLDSIIYGKQKTNVSYGRINGDKTQNYFFTETTPGKENLTKGYVNSLETEPPLFSQKGGFYSEALNINITVPKDSKVHYTLDGSEPSIHSKLYKKSLKFDSTTILRARAYYKDKFPSAIITQSYFVKEKINLPVVSLSINPENLFSSNKGIYVNGENYDSTDFRSPNYYNDWAAQANFEYFDKEGVQQLNMKLEYKLTGELRNYPIKSFKLTAKPKFDHDYIDYPFFENRNRTQFKSLAFRHGGWPDLAYTLIRDGVIQTQSGRNYDMDYQEYKPCVVFYNGQYYGIHNIRERFTEKYFKDIHNCNFSEMDILEGRNQVIKGTAKAYTTLMWKMDKWDMKDPTTFEKIDREIDLNQYANYLATEIYFANTDWPAKNIKYWKKEGGKWRWIIFDTDFGLGLKGKHIHNTIDFMYSESAKGLNAAWSSKLFRTLMKNPKFKSLFIQKISVLMDTYLSTQELSHTVKIFSSNLEPEIGRHAERWSHFSSKFSWGKHVKHVQAFVEKREGNLRKYIQDFYKLSGRSKITFKVNDTEGGRIKVMGLNFDFEHKVFQLYNGLSITYEAVAKPGYIFAGWKNAKSSKPQENQIVRGDKLIEALFIKKSGTILPGVISNDMELSKKDAPFYGLSDVEVLAGVRLTIGKGVTIEMAEAANMIVNGSIEVNGTQSEPVVFKETEPHKSWGALVLLNTDKLSSVKHTKFIHATHGHKIPRDQAAISLFNSDMDMDFIEVTDVYGQPIFAQESKVNLTNSKVRSAITGDLINVKRGWAKVDNCEFIGNNKVDTDAIDYDGIKGGIISNNHIHGFYGFNSDGIDLGEESINIQVEGNKIHDCSDKGISVGQASTGVFKNNVIYACEQGVGVKDINSYAMIENCTFYGNGYAIAAFEKNQSKGGGKIDIVNSILSNSYFANTYYDNLSAINASYCLIDKEQSLKGNDIFKDDPLFANAIASNYQLKPNSPCYGKGDPKYNENIGAVIKLKASKVNYQNIKMTEVFSNSIIDGKEDWIEIYNNSNEVIDLAGLYFSDSKKNLEKMKISNSNPKETRVPAKSYLLLICDKDSAKGNTHINFKIRATGDVIYLSKKVNDKIEILDSVVVPDMDSISSYSRYALTTYWYRTKKLSPLEFNNKYKPTFVSVPTVAVKLGSMYTYNIKTHDKDTKKINIKIIEGPKGLSLTQEGDSKALLKGKLSEKGVYNVVISASDGLNVPVLQTFSLTVH